MQQLGAECNFSMQGKARGLSMEGVGECGTAERLVRSLAQGLARRASSGSGAWALCGNTPPSRFRSLLYTYSSYRYWACIVYRLQE